MGSWTEFCQAAEKLSKCETVAVAALDKMTSFINVILSDNSGINITKTAQQQQQKETRITATSASQSCFQAFHTQLPLVQPQNSSPAVPVHDMTGNSQQQNVVPCPVNIKTEPDDSGPAEFGRNTVTL